MASALLSSLRPPSPPFPPRDCGVACHRVMESERVEWLGVGSIRYRYFDVSSSLRCRARLQHCIMSTRSAIEPGNLSLAHLAHLSAAAEQCGRRFSSSRCRHCLPPVSKASLRRKRLKRICCALESRGEWGGLCYGIGGIGCRGIDKMMATVFGLEEKTPR